MEESCFYAHDGQGSLYRVNWGDTRELREGSEVYVRFDAVRRLTYEDGYPSGWTPAYEVTATSVTLNLPFPLPDFHEKELQSFGWDAYIHVYDEKTSLSAVRKYVRELEELGFTILCHDNGSDRDEYLGDAYLLYRDTVTVMLEKSDYVCNLRYHISAPPTIGQPTSQELLAMLDNENMEMISMIGDISFVEDGEGRFLLRVIPMHSEGSGPVDYEFTVEDGHILILENGEKIPLFVLLTQSE